MDKSYLELFFGESQEHLSRVNSCLVILEKEPSNSGALDEIFRLMHTLKSMAATVGFDGVADLAHSLEDVFDELRAQRMAVTPEVMDVVFSCLDAFNLALDELRQNNRTSVDFNQYKAKLKKAVSGSSKKKAPKEKKEKKKERKEETRLTRQEKEVVEKERRQNSNIYRIDIFITEDCPMKGARAFLILARFKQTGRIIKLIPSEESLKKGDFENKFSLIFAANKPESVIREKLEAVLEIKEIKIKDFKTAGEARNKEKAAEKVKPQPEASSSYMKKIQSMRIPVERLDKTMNFMGELSIAKSRLLETVQVKGLKDVEEISSIIDRLVSSLQDETLQMRLLPISYILDAFPRVVRDLARKLGKEVDLQIKGGGIELDRVILDEIGNPLMHLVRNAIDHGLEDKETRKKAGKDPKGKIVIEVARRKGHVAVELSDDGRGVDVKKVAQKAVEKGLIDKEEAAEVDVKQALNLMSSPGFSTAFKVTDVSGRGVGLDVVKAKLDSLSGRLDLESELGKGSKFILTLPLTLAIIKAMLVGLGEQVFTIPIMKIRESIKIEAQNIKTVQGKEVIIVRDEIIPLVRLDREMGISYQGSSKERLSVVIAEGGTDSLGVLVDRIIGEQDIVVKPLGSIVGKVQGIAGATILGNGRVSLILDVVNLSEK